MECMELTKSNVLRAVIYLLTAIFFLPDNALVDDQPQWGQRYTRNMVSSETGLPERFDPKTG